MQQLPVGPGDMCHSTFEKGPVSCSEFLNRARKILGHESCALGDQRLTRQRGGKGGQVALCKDTKYTDRALAIPASLVSRA